MGGAFGGFASGDGAFQLLALWAVTGGFFSLRFNNNNNNNIYFPSFTFL